MKVGEYVRTDNCIGKVYDICHKEEDYYKFIIENHGTLRICDSDYIVKSSPNIIDLIEVGDYVNGEQVSRIKQCPEYHLGNGILIFNEHNETIYSNFRTSKYYDIKSIVTKEQFSQMEYRIGE